MRTRSKHRRDCFTQLLYARFFFQLLGGVHDILASLGASDLEEDTIPAEYRARLDASIGENMDRYFARTVTLRVEEEETDAARDTWNTAREIREADLALRHPRNPDACKAWGRTCEFFVVCTREVDLNDPTAFRTHARAKSPSAILEHANPHPPAPSPARGEGEQAECSPLSPRGRGVGGEGARATLIDDPARSFGSESPNAGSRSSA
jgi:hypothetical protein